MNLLWRSTIWTFFLLVLLTRAQLLPPAFNSTPPTCDPTCNSCAVLGDPRYCSSCNGDAFILTGNQGVCFCQGATANNATCTPQSTYQGGSSVYSLMGNFSQAIANEWHTTAPIAFCNAGQALLNLSAQNPTVSYGFPGMVVPTHQVAVVTLKVEVFVVPNSSINVTLNCDGFTMTKYYNSSTTGLSNGACNINGTAFLEDTVSFSVQDTSTMPTFSISVQADNKSWVGVRNFQFQASNCSSNCAGSCSGPGPNQCLQCPVGSIGPVNGVCTCLDNSTVLPNGSCAGVSSLICPTGCSRCSNFGDGVPQCYQCLPGYSLLPVEDGHNLLYSVCIANNALLTNNHALEGPACHPSCRQCYGSSQHQCSSCYSGFTLQRIGDVSHCMQVMSGISPDNLTADSVVASTNLSQCQVSWTSHHMCTAITEQYLSNLQAGHWLSASGSTQQMFIETQAPNTVCETCMQVVLLYVYPNQTTTQLNYQTTVVDVGQGMQNITYSANFTPENIKEWNCLLSSDNATMTWYTCSFQLAFGTMDNNAATYGFNITSYINYFVNDSIDIIDLMGAAPGTESNDTELCTDATCTAVRTNSSYTNNESADIQICLPDQQQTGNNLTLTKSNITAVVALPNGSYLSFDLTNQATQDQVVNCVKYIIPLSSLPVGNVTFLIQSKIIPWPLGSRRFLQGADTPLNSVQQSTVHIQIQYPEAIDYTPTSYNPNQSSQVPSNPNERSDTWWIVGASILGGAILIVLVLIVYMGIKERSRRPASRSNSRKLSDMQPTTGVRVLSSIPQQSSNPDIQPKRSGSIEQPTTVIIPQVPVLPALPTYVPQEPKSAAIPKGSGQMKKLPSGGFIV